MGDFWRKTSSDLHSTVNWQKKFTAPFKASKSYLPSFQIRFMRRYALKQPKFGVAFWGYYFIQTFCFFFYNETWWQFESAVKYSPWKSDNLIPKRTFKGQNCIFHPPTQLGNKYLLPVTPLFPYTLAFCREDRLPITVDPWITGSNVKGSLICRFSSINT